MSFVFLFLIFSDSLVCGDRNKVEAREYFSKEILKRYNQGYDSFSVKNNFFWQYCLKDRREATCFFFFKYSCFGYFCYS
jgi:hypothetical protein